MLKCDLIQRLMAHINSEFSSVQFKLLGTLRMVIDGQGMVGQNYNAAVNTVESLLQDCCFGL